MSKSRSNKPSDHSHDSGQAEKLYRFHPEFGFTEVSQSEQANTNTHANTDTQAGFPYENPKMEGQVPPFVPQNPYHNCYQGAGYHNGFHGMPYGMYGAGQYGPYHHKTEHMRQMQEYANQHAAYVANMNGNFQNSNHHEHANHEFTQERMQEMYGTFNDIMNGKAEPAKILGLFQAVSSDFWKGAALGAAAIALYNCSPIKDMIGTSLAALLAAVGLTPQDDNHDDGFDDDEFDDLQAEGVSAETNCTSTNADTNSSDK